MNCINNTYQDGKLRLYWTGGAGFVITLDSLKIGIDLYLSDACHNKETGECKRLTLAPCKGEDLDLDYLISTHDHGDHFDVIAVPAMLEANKKMKIICPSSVIAFAETMGLDTSRFIRLDRGMRFDDRDFSLLAVTADHQDQSPDAIGVMIQIAGKEIFFAGDGTYHDNYTKLTMGRKGFDILLVAINGQYGNPDAYQAADIAGMLEPKLAIPCHYWLFKEHGGDPMTFVKACAAKEPSVNSLILAIGEEYIIEG